MDYYRIARIVNTFGIQGEVKIISDTDFPHERFAVGERITILKDNKAFKEVTVENFRQQKGTYIVKFEEFNHINELEGLKDLWLAITEDQQHELDDFEFYYHEIIGLKVYTLEDEFIGTIKDILALGSNDVWVIKRVNEKKKDILIPYIADVVKEVDLVEGRVMVELMEGLMSDED